MNYYLPGWACLNASRELKWSEIFTMVGNLVKSTKNLLPLYTWGTKTQSAKVREDPTQYCPFEVVERIFSKAVIIKMGKVNKSRKNKNDNRTGWKCKNMMNGNSNKEENNKKCNKTG